MTRLQYHPRILAIYLNGAAALRAQLRTAPEKRRAQGDYRTPEDFKRLARRDVMTARALRLGVE